MDRRVSVGFVVALAVTTVVAGLLIVLVLAPRLTPGIPDAPPPPAWGVPAEAPPASVVPVRGGVAGLADEEWVLRVAEATGIPPRALAAYAGVALWKAEDFPECGLSWTTLAGVGAIESDHGRHGGSSIGEDGTVRPPIFGPALDGESGAHIPDSDGGAIDGDAEVDRAVGPMQLIPEAWRNWHVDGGGDGVEDPQNIDDAAMAAANYLCRASGAMAGEEGWRVGILAYNRSASYAQSVADAANHYRERARPDE